MNKFWKFLIVTALVFSVLTGCDSADNNSTNGITPPPAAGEGDEGAALSPNTQPSDDISSDSHSSTIPVIFSHGGAPCDIGASVYLTKHPNVDLIGMVLSRGEIRPENALDDWAVFLYDVLKKKDAAIALGSDERMDPNSHEFPEAWRNAADNFWGLTLPEQETEFETASGPDLIVELVNSSPEKVTLVAMASMIDIAWALQQDPGIIDNIREVIIMGGAFNMKGNLDEGPDPTSNEVAEWNMYIDAQAAKYLFNSGVPISIVPLDAIQYLVQPEDVNIMNSISGPGVTYVSQMWNQQINSSGGEGFLIWDTITITAVTNPENFNWVYDGVDVIAETGDFQGQTIALNNGAQHTRYAIGADYEAVLEQVFETFRGETPLAPPSDVIITELAGTWEGFTGDFHITFYLDSACKLYEKCGTFEISEFTLTGDISFVDIHDNVYEFKATNISSGQPGNEYEYLQLLEDGTLKFHTEDSGETSEAILTKK